MYPNVFDSIVVSELHIIEYQEKIHLPKIFHMWFIM